jgi:hypothetical protein
VELCLHGVRRESYRNNYRNNERKERSTETNREGTKYRNEMTNARFKCVICKCGACVSETKRCYCVRISL